jgi:hypothetical protein
MPAEVTRRHCVVPKIFARVVVESVLVPDTEKLWVMVVEPAWRVPPPVAFVKFRLVVVAVVIVAVATEAFHQRVRSEERSPPPTRLLPAVIVLDDETALIPREKTPKVLS